MQEYYVTFRSVTAAMNALRRLDRAWIHTELVRTPRVLSAKGCGYSLRVRRGELADCLALLRREDYGFSRVFRRESDGSWAEVAQ